MNDTLTIKCPDCENVLLVDKKTGEIIEVRRPIVDQSSGDRFKDARAKVMDSKNRAERLFQEAKAKEHDKKARLEAFFNEKKEEFKGQLIEKPDRPIDRD